MGTPEHVTGYTLLSMSWDIHSLSRVRENGSKSSVLEPRLGSYMGGKTVAHRDALGPENGQTNPNADSQGAELIILKSLLPETQGRCYGFAQGWPLTPSVKF